MAISHIGGGQVPNIEERKTFAKKRHAAPKRVRLASPGGSEASCPSAIEVEQHIYVPQRLLTFFCSQIKENNT